MRAGVEHVVYTVSSCMVVGGHFYSDEMLLQGLVTRQAEAAESQSPTKEFLPLSDTYKLWLIIEKVVPESDDGSWRDLPPDDRKGYYRGFSSCQLTFNLVAVSCMR